MYRFHALHAVAAEPNSAFTRRLRPAGDRLRGLPTPDGVFRRPSDGVDPLRGYVALCRQTTAASPGAARSSYALPVLGVLVQLLVGVATVAAAFYAARAGARATELSTDQQERAARRQEWFHRMQWATDLTLADNPRSVAKGRALLAVLARSELATADDEALLEALNANPVLNELEQEYADTVDEVDFVTEDGDVPDR